MRIQDIKNLAMGWIEEHSSPNKDLPQSDRILEYWNILEDMIFHNNKFAFDVIIKIIEITSDEYIIYNVAAGPLESFIVKCDEISLSIIEQEAIKNTKFAFALRGVWQNLTPDHVWAKIVAIIQKTGG
jgi:hypothetical protein